MSTSTARGQWCLGAPRRFACVKVLVSTGHLGRSTSIRIGSPSLSQVVSGDFEISCRCPLYPRKRTFTGVSGMSALCQNRTHAVQQARCAGCNDLLDGAFDGLTSTAISIRVGKQVVQASRPLRGGLLVEKIDAGHVAAWPGKAGNKTLTGSLPTPKTIALLAFGRATSRSSVRTF